MAEEKKQINSDSPTEDTAKPKRARKKASGNASAPTADKEINTSDAMNEEKANTTAAERAEEPTVNTPEEDPASKSADEAVSETGDAEAEDIGEDLTAEDTKAITSSQDTADNGAAVTCPESQDENESAIQADLNESGKSDTAESAAVTEITDREPLFPALVEKGAVSDSSVSEENTDNEIEFTEETKPKEDSDTLGEAALVPADTGKPNDSHKAPEKSKSEGKKGPGIVHAIFDFVELFVFTLVAVLVITTFFVRQSVVEGDSMLGTLQDGDNLLISDFLYTPKAGDIVVCEDYSTQLRKPIIKRVIATEGQTVRITARSVIVDGKVLNEPYVFTDVFGYKYDVSIPHAVFRENAEEYKLKYDPGYYYEIVVPDGEIFVLGDHRNNSTDSRMLGTIDVDTVLGRVLIRFYPFEKFGTVE